MGTPSISTYGNIGVSMVLPHFELFQIWECMGIYDSFLLWNTDGHPIYILIMGMQGYLWLFPTVNIDGKPIIIPLMGMHGYL